jgi:thiamine biosynthesis lipoprotein
MLLSSCTSGDVSSYKKSRALIDTFVSVTVVAESRETAEKSIEKAFVTIEQFGDLVNFFSEKSEVSAINRNAGIRKVKVSPITLDIIEKALSVAQDSGGAYDPTIGPEISLWDFAHKIKPSDAEIRANLPLVNYRNILLDKEKSTVFLRKKGMLLDLGGIAKGYAADLAVQSLKQQGIRAGLVAVAGDIRAFGLKPDNKPWVVGIKNPRQEGSADEIIARVTLSGEAISTSGDYERYFIMDGQRFHHLLIPATGYPANSCQSVSVIADQGFKTDAFSTALFILGADKGLELAKQMGIDALIVDSQGTVHTTAGLQGKLTIERNH